MKRTITSRTHGVIDYTLGALLLAAPYIFSFADAGGAAVFIPQSVGGLIIVQSLMTDYEMSIVRLIPLRVHLWLDYAASLLLAASPWLFDFSEFPINGWLPHVVAGLGYFFISLNTKTVPETRHAQQRLVGR